MTIGDRIREYRKCKGMSAAAFAEKLGISGQAISQIENGKTTATERIIISICSAYQVSRDWLETGEGEMELLPLDDDAELFAQMLKIGKDSATINSLKAIAKMYIGLDEAERRTIDKMIREAVLATKKDPE